MWATAEAAREQWAPAEEARESAPVAAELVPSGEEIERICGSPDHQGVCADAGDYPYADAEALLAPEDALVVCLDQVHDPHNLGAICRVAECAGASGVVIPNRRAAQVTPAVCRASAGAVEHLQVARAGNLTTFLRPRQAARGVVLRREPAMPAWPTTHRTTAVASCWCWARRAGAFDRAWPRRATSSWRFRFEDESRRSTCRPPPPRCCTGSCTSREAVDNAS